MLPELNVHIHFVLRGEGTMQLDSDHQANQGCHRAIRDGWSEIYADVDSIHSNELRGHHAQLLQSQWVLGVVDVSQHIEN